MNKQVNILLNIYLHIFIHALKYESDYSHAATFKMYQVMVSVRSSVLSFKLH